MRILFTPLLFVLALFCLQDIQAQTPFAGFEHTHHFQFLQTRHNPAYVGHYSQPSFYVSSQLGNGNSAKRSVHNLAWQSSYDNLGYGIVANYSNLDPVNNTRMAMIGGQFSMDFEAFEKLASRVGVGFGALHYNNEFEPPPNSNVLTQAPATQNNEAFAKLNVDIGILIYTEKFRLGISMIHNNEPSFDFINADYTFQNNNGQLSTFNRNTVFRNRNFATLSYDFELSHLLTLTPNIITRYYLVSFGGGSRGSSNSLVSNNTDNFRMDANLTLAINKEIFIGASYVKSPNYIMNFLVAYRTLGGFQLSTSYSVKNSETAGNFSQFELGLGFFPEWE